MASMAASVPEAAAASHAADPEDEEVQHHPQWDEQYHEDKLGNDVKSLRNSLQLIDGEHANEHSDATPHISMEFMHAREEEQTSDSNFNSDHKQAGEWVLPQRHHQSQPSSSASDDDSSSDGSNVHHQHSSDDAEEQQSQRRTVFYTNTQSSNEEPNKYRPIRTVNGKYIDSYSCQHALQDNVPTQSLILEFDYEVSMERGTSLDDNIQALEWNLLERLVNVMNLNRCDPSMTFTDGDVASVNRGTGNNGRRLNFLNSVMELSSFPKDRIFITETCQWIQVDEQVNECYAIKGLMSLGMRTDFGISTDEMNTFFQAATEFEMKQDTIFVGHINGVGYVGDRATGTPPFPEIPSTGPDNAGPPLLPTTKSRGGLESSVPLLSAVLSVSVISVLAATIFLVFRIRKEGEKDENEDDLSLVALEDDPAAAPGMDIEGGVVANKRSVTPMTGAEPALLELSSSSSGEDNTRSAFVNGASSASRNAMYIGTLGAIDTSMYPSNSIDSDDVPSRMISPTSAVVAGSSITPNSNGLPPRPPMARRHSQKLKKRRKRKKKKKKVVLKRVNSKDNIRVMETISESEDSEFTDSEYSTDDDYGADLTPRTKMQELYPGDVFPEWNYTEDDDDDDDDDTMQRKKRRSKNYFAKKDSNEDAVDVSFGDMQWP